MNASSGDEAERPGTALPKRVISVNQVVAFNMAYYRKAAGMTQDDLGERLGGWSGASISAAERSWDGKRVRKFDADEVASLALALGVPVAALLLPPAGSGVSAQYEFEVRPDLPPVSAEDILAAALPHYERESPVMAAFMDRLMALGASRYIEPGLKRAEQVISVAMERALSLERDAQERHRQAMSSLVGSREALERRVDDLREFEREYRARLLAYLEGQMRDLRAGADDSGVFPAIGSPRRTTSGEGEGS